MRPLAGVRVLDLSRLLPGPFATLALADLGAEVDKVEDPHGGDYLRHMPPQVAGENVAFHALNRGKRSLVLDLKHPRGRDALLRLLPRYDVLFEQFRPGVLERLGLAHSALLEAHPRLVVCALTGYGQTGPLARRAGHDLNYLATSGLLGAMGPASGVPQVPSFQLADVSGGLWAALAIVAALRERDRTGKGTVLDVSMTDGLLAFAPFAFGAALANEPVTRGGEALTGGIAPYGVYRTSDGKFVTLAALEPKFFLAFAAAVGLEADLSALAPGPHQEHLRQKIAAVFASKTRDEWAAVAASLDVCIAPVLEPGEALASDHHRARALSFSLPTPRGDVPQLRLPVTPLGMAGSDGSVAVAPPPRMGEHTRAALTEAGLSEAEIDDLVSCGAAREGA
jgi:alpha-methylacyl-CoA racemase